MAGHKDNSMSPGSPYAEISERLQHKLDQQKVRMDVTVADARALDNRVNAEYRLKPRYRTESGTD